jgi:hypothetical protein
LSLLLADQDFNQRIVTLLAGLGHDIVSPVDLGWSNIRVEDCDVLKTALQQGRAVLTHNGWHFKKLHAESVKPGQHVHCGVIVCSQVPRDREPAIAQRIDQAIRVSVPLDGVLVRVHLNGYRVTR